LLHLGQQAGCKCCKSIQISTSYVAQAQELEAGGACSFDTKTVSGHENTKTWLEVSHL